MVKGNCQLCGKEKDLDKHHIDYNKDIILLACRNCHNHLHRIKRKIWPLAKQIDLECQKCDYKWTYKGANPFYATCPNCLIKVKVEDRK